MERYVLVDIDDSNGFAIIDMSEKGGKEVANQIYDITEGRRMVYALNNANLIDKIQELEDWKAQALIGLQMIKKGVEILETNN